MIRTDLAMESGEWLKEQNQSLNGIEIQEENRGEIKITRVKVLTPEGEKQLGKPIGQYITLEDPRLREQENFSVGEIVQGVADEIKKLLPPPQENPDQTLLVIGLGNRHITADALGPGVVDKIMVTRHLFRHMPSFTEKGMASVCAIAPGVLGLSGMETQEVVKGLVDEVKPYAVVVIDALAARRVQRMNTTIQISDTGIVPGSGVGNYRNELSQNTLGVKVVSVGIPTVIYASNLIRDAAFDALKQEISPQDMGEALQELVVTTKDIDDIIEQNAYVVASGINTAMHSHLTLEEILENSR